ncbi:hypothetical protein PSHT_07173 [Puccinia striiformis]|uniref:NADH dehydrogenase [ubiquinone] 1 alpha subcomplex subunit n=1 Tax=Puccinia striiformis TaxID=27350 RepID=A0A2S4W0F2_9BASI|nr:hypothetical protein H4Q26_004512 [Puccinia striiformis f. sp. tritici PST-130]POW15231.1 hypothetical protein PSHT_07173 [Puccinia striiformis]
MIYRAFQRLQRALGIGKERFYVGNDLAGNSYYEKHLPVESRPRRFVNFKSNPDDPTLYRTHHLSPQWSAWLSFTRKHPPSLDELQADQLRLAQLRENVKRLKTEDQARKQTQLENQSAVGTTTSTSLDLRESVDPVDDRAELDRKRRIMSESPLAAFTLQPQSNPDQTWQPQSWKPQQITRK